MMQTVFIEADSTMGPNQTLDFFVKKRGYLSLYIPSGRVAKGFRSRCQDV